MNRWDALTNQVSELLKVRRVGSLVFARCVWQSDTPLPQVPAKLARLLEALSQWMQQVPSQLHLERGGVAEDSTLVVEFHPSATAILTHLRWPRSDSPGGTKPAIAAQLGRTLGLDLFLLGTLGAVYLDGTQSDWPHDPLTIPDVPANHPLRQQIESIWAKG